MFIFLKPELNHFLFLSFQHRTEIHLIIFLYKLFGLWKQDIETNRLKPPEIN